MDRLRNRRIEGSSKDIGAHESPVGRNHRRAEFIRRSTAEVVIGTSSFVDHPLLNGDPTQMPFVTR